ncbi:FAD-dependent monooxygenase [Kribbella speibonae]|uniref:2-polyprenyl-6-methoxyphenol hydroxylase n=1 Tax=Kribbella speibonae TaxID=1572660 RepID=A0A4R0IAT0_9ACTN|nr:FAD-dependent monooxygenase [Kribbella speibonae]TCC28890.1 2-polyprenyl-6-methoxyphenol hydroxylase [Kribbella speibonae]
MRIAIVGGGPGGLFLATLVKAGDPAAEVTVFERNRADDTFGFGVVFSDATLAGIHAADPVVRDALTEYGVHWDAIEVRLKGERFRCGGMGMAAIARKTLLAVLHERASSVGVTLRFQTEVELEDLTGFDLVVAADGANSRIRERLAAVLEPMVETAAAKFIWFGTTYHFDGLTFVHERSADGVFAVHGYPISPEVSTFIVETDRESWLRAGLDEFDVAQPPGPSDLKTKQYLEKLFAEQIEGHPLLVNNSRWASFRTRRTGRWSAGNVVLLGDAVHTAHFSVGSGTKMAMEDAIALAGALAAHEDIPAALAAYEESARPSVEKIQGSARPSLSWWEHFGRYHDTLEPWQFAFHFLTRSISGGKLARRDPAFVAATRAAWQAEHGSAPLETPFRSGGLHLPGRVVDVHHSPTRSDPGGAGSGERGVPRPAVVGEWSTSAVLWLEAPATEHELPGALASLHSGALAGPAIVAVYGGSRLTRTLLAEEARLVAGVPAMVVDDELTPDDAETLLLSGRADLVGRTNGADRSRVAGVSRSVGGSV